MAINAGVVLFRQRNGEIEVLLISHRSRDQRFLARPPQWKFPGGSSKDHPEERSGEETALREFFEETGLSRKRGAKSIATGYFKGSSIRRFYFLYNEDDFEGDLRQNDLEDGTDTLSKPQWFPIKETYGLIYKTHVEILDWALKHIPSLTK